ncbi:MAG: hypothetical protein GX791_07590, partial [Synergistaceae bacterium]|nr:hypothetical protein [Synergistaceae bacterium]
MTDKRKNNEKFFVVGEVFRGRLSSTCRELAGKARQLADSVEGEVTVILLSDGLAEDPKILFSSGADRVMVVEHPSLALYNQEIETNVLSFLLKKENPAV